jgi:pyridoxal phosphate enzyme (YggS family)
MELIQNFRNIKNQINILNSKVNLIVVTKGQNITEIKPILDEGHLHFGENKVQEATQKWTNILSSKKDINLHLLGKLQSNKAKEAFNLFNYIHSLDNEKLAKIFSNLESTIPKKIKYFVQVNIGNESQKNGIEISLVSQFVEFCRNDLKLNILGLMCIPPANESPESYFKKLYELNRNNKLEDLSMGMSEDFKIAIKLGATYVRIGSAIFGKKTN